MEDGVLGDSPSTSPTTEGLDDYVGEDGYAKPSVKLLIEAMRTRLHIEDDAHIWAACACAVSNMLATPPLWLMLVGSPSSGKTEIIDVLGDVSTCHLKELTEAGLLSWSATRTTFMDDKGRTGTRRDPKPAGILTRVGSRGFVTFSDYSTVLAFSDHGRREGLFSALRTIYDGEWSRDLGNRERSLTWKGRLTFLAACTQAIDHYGAHNSVLGDRWLYVRTPEMDEETERKMQRRAMDAYNEQDSDEQMANAIRNFAKETIQAATQKLDNVTVPVSVMTEIATVAKLTCLGRAGVKRERGDIVGYPIIERPPRMTKQLMTLAQCLLALDAGEERTRAVCTRVALDSMPEQRRRILEVLATERSVLLNTSNIARLASLNRTATKQTLEDLEAIGLVESDQADSPEQHDSRRGQARWWYLATERADFVVSLLG